MNFILEKNKYQNIFLVGYGRMFKIIKGLLNIKIRKTKIL